MNKNKVYSKGHSTNDTSQSLGKQICYALCGPGRGHYSCDLIIFKKADITNWGTCSLKNDYKVALWKVQDPAFLELKKDMSSSFFIKCLLQIQFWINLPGDSGAKVSCWLPINPRLRPISQTNLNPA